MDTGSLLADRYRLISLLGRGGMGEVWRAEHLGLKAPVAIKLMNPSIAFSSEALQRFNREAQSAANLRSPHVVQILDHGVDAATRTPFIAMELMEGESLAHRIGRLGRLPVAETVRIVIHIARALSRAHDADIVHRDLKPDNVFLVQNEDEEIAKVLDFGIAKAKSQSLSQDAATRTGAVMGTPYYMSPEQIGGEKSVDQRTDLWALGVIACECLTGRRPFDADNIGGLVLAICTQPLPQPSALGPVPPGFDTWFERALQRDPARRFQSARELADALRRAIGNESSMAAGVGNPIGTRTVDGPAAGTAATDGPLSRTKPNHVPGLPTARWSRPFVFAGALLALAGGGAGVWMVRASSTVAPEAPSDEAQAPSTPPEPVNIAPPPVASVVAAPVIAAPPSAQPSSAPARAAKKPTPATPPKPSAAPKAKPKPAEDSGSIFDRRKG